MEPVFKFTRTQIQEAFKKWNADYLDNKGEFEEINRETTHIGQADDLIRFLMEN